MRSQFGEETRDGIEEGRGVGGGDGPDGAASSDSDVTDGHDVTVSAEQRGKVPRKPVPLDVCELG
eukprot:750509-Hanusia_phi.AAC.3